MRAGTNAAVETGLVSRTRVDLWLGLLLLVLVFCAFCPSLSNGFVNFDDPDYITGNDHVRRGLTAEAIRWAFGSSEVANWHPLTWLSHMLDCQIFGLAAWGHHLTSLLLHAANTLLLYALLVGMTAARWRSFIVAALFGLHPLRVESVAWAAERKDVLSAFFFMLTLGAYVIYARKQNNPASDIKLEEDSKLQGPAGRRFQISRYYILALVSFGMGLMSKPMLVTLPFTLLLLDFWPLQRWPCDRAAKLLLEKAPFLLVAVLASTVTFLVQRSGGAMTAALPLNSRVENAPVAYCRYLGKLFWPAGLAAFYPPVPHWPLAEVVMAALLLSVFTGLAVLTWRSRPYIAVGWFWFVGMLVPVIGLVPVGEQSMADRYSYLPSIGLLIALVWGMAEWSRGWSKREYVVTGATVAAVAGCLIATRGQVQYWRNTETLFQHALRVTHSNYLAHHNLGTQLEKEGRLQEATDEFKLALLAKPDYAPSFNNWGIVLDKQGRLEEAMQRFKQAIDRNSGYADPHYNLGASLEKMGRYDEARQEYQTAIRLKPAYADAHYNLGVAWGRQGNLDEAAREFKSAIKLKRDSPDAYNNLGVTCERQNKLDEAIACYEVALRLDPQYVSAHFNLGVALSRNGRLDDAIAEFQAALRLKPDYAQAAQNLRALLQMERQGAPPKSK